MKLLCVVLVAACGDNVVDKTAACSLATATSAATVQDRKIIGAAAPYTPDLALAMRDDELRTSIAARRAAAWQVVARVLEPVPLAEPKLAPVFGGEPTIPAWHTWYTRDDFERVFAKLYEDLGPSGRRARAAFSDADVDAGFAWNTHALDDLPDWPEQRYLDYLGQIDTDAEAQGVAGANRVAYSTGAMRKLIRSYAKQDACRRAPDPPAFADDPVRPGVPAQASERVAVAGCEWHVLGPYVAGDGEFRVTMQGDGDADLYVRIGAPPDATHHDCKSTGDASDEACTVSGKGPIYVAVFGAAPSAVDVSVDYTTADVRDPACLDGEMPRDAVVVKADWHRRLDGDLLPVFDTSAARMAQRLAGDADWAAGDGAADPEPSSIYSVTLPSGARFRMPALHVMTKELDHWLWITLWWSPRPDDDFGADRPASIGGVWRNYKMCVTTGYVELDADPRGGQAGSLGDALAAVHGGASEPTWCSNPYLEAGAGNAATNCIGCHQHGGTGLLAEQILATQPHRGTTRVRNNFFTDYSWAIKGGRGDELSATVQAELDYWDASD